MGKKVIEIHNLDFVRLGLLHFTSLNLKFRTPEFHPEVPPLVSSLIYLVRKVPRADERVPQIVIFDTSEEETVKLFYKNGLSLL